MYGKVSSAPGLLLYVSQRKHVDYIRSILEKIEMQLLYSDKLHSMHSCKAGDGDQESSQQQPPLGTRCFSLQTPHMRFKIIEALKPFI